MNEKEDIARFDHKFLPGWHNRAIRYYFYLNKGLDMLNQSRNLFLGIFALYFALKLENPVWLLAMFIPSVLILLVLGYYQTHYMNKVLDFIGIRFSTHYGVKSYNLQQGIYDTLQEINKKL